MKAMAGLVVGVCAVAVLSLLFMVALMALAGVTLAVLLYGLVLAIRQARQRQQSTPDWLVSRRQVVATLPERMRGDFQTKTFTRADASGHGPWPFA